MATQILTDSIVRALPTPTKKDATYRDAKVRGLAVRVMPRTGSKGWYLTYFASGRRHQVAMGQFPQLGTARARAMAADLKEQVKFHGANPALQQRDAREAPSVADLVDAYIKAIAGKLRSAADVTNALNRDVRPALGAMKVGQVQPHHCQRLHDAITKRGSKRRADQVLGMVRRIFKINKVTPNPAADIQKHGYTNRDRVLDMGELVKVWRAAQTQAYPFGDIVRLLMLTGARKSEIAGLRWAEIDLDRKQINLPAARSKNGKPHLVPLSDPAVQIIKALPHPDDATLVFSTTTETSVSGFSRAKRNLDKLAGIAEWHIHDIRRSIASHLADDDLGVDVVVVERLLNHISGTFGGVTGVYQHARMEKRKRHAVDVWAAHLQKHLTPLPGAQIIPLRA